MTNLLKGSVAAVNKLGAAASVFSSDYKPALGFYFRAGFAEQMALGLISDMGGLPNSHADSKFQEVSGLNMSLEVEAISEGGNNEFVHQLPTKTKYENLILKRGLLASFSDIATWCRQTITGGLSSKIMPRDLFVELMSPDSLVPLMFWRLEGAYPIKWEVSNFNSQESAIVVETLEFTYRTMTVVNLGMVSL